MRFAFCKIRYDDPSSFRRGTVDGAIVRLDTDAAFMYSVIYGDGMYEEIGIHECQSIKYKKLRMLQDEVVEQMRANNEKVTVICRDDISWLEVQEHLKEDLEVVPPPDQLQVITELSSCLEQPPKKKGRKRRV